MDSFTMCQEIFFLDPHIPCQEKQPSILDHVYLLICLGGRRTKIEKIKYTVKYKAYILNIREN